jgi:glycosyltransferase involved in cell wall biosynthesis
MRILFVSHTAGWSGAEVAMMRLVDALRSDHEICIACPAGGHMAEAVERAGVVQCTLPAVDASLRLDPVWTPIGVNQLALGGVALRRAARRFRADVVHANSLRAGLLAAIGLRNGGPPIVVQAHEHLPDSRIGRVVRSVIADTATSVVGVSDHTVENFNDRLRRPVATRVYISIDHDRFRPSGVLSAPVREELGLSADVILLGEVAQITPWKGQDTAIRTLAEMRRLGTDAHLLIVGRVAFEGRGVRYDNRGFRRDLDRLVDQLRVRDCVHFLGWREDIPELLSAMELSLLPSRDEPFGMSVAESMAMGTPTLVSNGGGPTEYIKDGQSGRILPAGRHDLWAQAAQELLDDRPARARMAEMGRHAVARFSDETYTREMIGVFRRACELRLGRARRVDSGVRHRWRRSGRERALAADRRARQPQNHGASRARGQHVATRGA